MIFADYDCTQFCSPILGLANAALKTSGLKPGADYRLVVIGFNPRATSADAKRMVEGEIGSTTAIGRATTALIATEPIAARLTSAVGYHYAYDAESGRYAHPVALFDRDRRRPPFARALGARHLRRRREACAGRGG